MSQFDLRCVRVGYDQDRSTTAVYDPKPQPGTYIIDKAGPVRHTHQGYHDGDEEKVARPVDELLAR